MSLRTKMDIAAMLEFAVEYHDDGYYAYKPGHSDSTIARQLNCSTQMVVGVRKELHGSCFRSARTRGGTKGEQLEQRLANIEKTLEWVCKTLSKDAKATNLDPSLHTKYPTLVPRWDKPVNVDHSDQ